MIQFDILSYKRLLLNKIFVSLGLIILICLASFFMKRNYLSENDMYSEIINISGRQRMLSQRINYFLVKYFDNTSDETLAKLEREVELMSESHRKLTSSYFKEMSLSRAAQKIYFNGERPLNELILGYLEKVMELAQARKTGKEYSREEFQKILTLSEDELLVRLNKVVEVYEEEAQQVLETIKVADLISTVSLILIVLLAFFFVLEPIVKKTILTMHELDEEKEKAFSAMNARTLFLANMSHEIRTPLNGIMGMMQLLEQTQLNKEQKRYIDLTFQSVGHLSLIINDILDISKIESGQFKINKNTFSLREFCQNLDSIFQTLAKQKEITFTFDYNTDCDEFIISDELRLRQVINNLVSNSLKFTDEKGVISLTLFYDSKKRVLNFSIQDSGIGMDEDAQENVFKQFYQADQSNRKRYEGTGLGLAICKNFVEALDGEIGVESELGVGTKFFFYVQAELGEANLKTVQGESDLLKKLKILVAEDNKVNQIVISKLLEKMRIDYQLVENGQDVIGLYENGAFDAILMDVRMPVMDGLEATKEIISHHPEAVVIGLSANAYPEDKQEAYDSGMSFYLSKPVKIEELVSVLNQVKKKGA